ncbi:Hypothetical protein A7982_09891 [Minicystis rosea]|nr:Hypothetical protein A7982_09891 [Minicystis rosea]
MTLLARETSEEEPVHRRGDYPKRPRNAAPSQRSCGRWASPSLHP